MHKSLEVLKQEIEQAHQLVKVGALYAHYKHLDQAYKVTGLSILEATDEVAVLYSPINEPSIVFARPLQSWLEKVHVNEKVTPRFQPFS